MGLGDQFFEAEESIKDWLEFMVNLHGNEVYADQQHMIVAALALMQAVRENVDYAGMTKNPLPSVRVEIDRSIPLIRVEIDYRGCVHRVIPEALKLLPAPAEQLPLELQPSDG
jgi:hypothetical protein